MSRKQVFGPVASRRLGVSLGVDLVVPKLCSLDCVYCEASRTTQLSCKRDEYVDVNEVIRQLDEVLKDAPNLDYITFSGAGEPTLNSRIGDVVSHIKTNYPQYKLCLLTNAGGFHDPEVRSAIKGVDLVVPSLDASNQEEFEKINRPATGLTFELLLSGLRSFCSESVGAVDLEIFIVPDVNDSDSSIERFVDIVKSLKVSKVQLNTLDRPGVEPWVRPSSGENTQRFIEALEPFVPVEAVGPFRYKSATLRQELPANEVSSRVLELASRRPVTLDDLVVALEVEDAKIVSVLTTLVGAGQLSSERNERGEFFRCPQN